MTVLLTTARVAGVYVGLPGRVESVAVPKIALTIEGVDGDRHYGISKPAGVREKGYLKGTSLPGLVDVTPLER